MMRKLYVAAGLGLMASCFAACLFPDLSAFENTSSAGAGHPSGSGPGTGGSGASGGTGAGSQQGSGGTGGSGGSGGDVAPDGGPLDYCQLGQKQSGPEAIETPGLPAHTRCIDVTEVSFAQYQEFLDFAGDIYSASTDLSKKYQIGSVKSECAYKDGKAAGDHPYRPDDNNWHPYDKDRTGLGNRPVEGVDWCDAWGYCRHAGKELCGSASGKPIDTGASSWDETTEWYSACSTNAPWPDEAGVPNCFSELDSGTDVDRTLDVDSGCTGKDGKLQHMLSNVWEWEDNCTKKAGGDSKEDPCFIRGEPDIAPGKECNWTSPTPRGANGFGDHVGIRCCWPVHQPAKDQ